VHAVLASIDLDAGPEAIQAPAAIQGRMFDATQDEIHPRSRRLRRPFSTPFCAKRPSPVEKEISGA
jgi:hypothetical protein